MKTDSNNLCPRLNGALWRTPAAEIAVEINWFILVWTIQCESIIHSTGHNNCRPWPRSQARALENKLTACFTLVHWKSSVLSQSLTGQCAVSVPDHFKWENASLAEHSWSWNVLFNNKGIKMWPTIQTTHVIVLTKWFSKKSLLTTTISLTHGAWLRIRSYIKQLKIFSSKCFSYIFHLVLHICVDELDQHWFK